MDVANEMVFPLPSLDKCTYTEGFSEENVWHLCKLLEAQGEEAVDISKFYVVFISNTNRQVMLFGRKTSKSPNVGSIVDYHVILVGNQIGQNKESYVWDLDSDSSLDFPTQVDVYFSRVLRNDLATVPNHLRRKYRIVPVRIFLAEFSSDRRHMKSQKDGRWMKPPPSKDIIPGEKAESVHTLHLFAGMTEPKPGIIVADSFEFLSFFTAHVNSDPNEIKYKKPV